MIHYISVSVSQCFITLINARSWGLSLPANGLQTLNNCQHQRHSFIFFQSILSQNAHPPPRFIDCKSSCCHWRSSVPVLYILAAYITKDQWPIPQMFLIIMNFLMNNNAKTKLLNLIETVIISLHLTHKFNDKKFKATMFRAKGQYLLSLKGGHIGSRDMFLYKSEGTITAFYYL